MDRYNGNQDLSQYHHLLMGDISGIQSFIFNVKSEGAAKTLKGRSFFVHALAELCLHLIEDHSEKDNNLLFYNGGGSFYAFCKHLPELDKIREIIQRDLADTELYLTLTEMDFHPERFGKVWEMIHEKANHEKLRKYNLHFGAFPNTPQRPETALNNAGDDAENSLEWDWKGFIGRFKKSDAYEIKDGYKIQPGKRIYNNQIIALGRAWKIQGATPLNQAILRAFPLWEYVWNNEGMAKFREELEQREQDKDPKFKVDKDDVLEFESLAYEAKLRTGTDKLGVLKMDVDFLGDAFQKASTAPQAYLLSGQMQEFFSSRLFKIWSEEGFSSTGKAPVPYKENIYILFAGGDDCMFIGGWDAVFEFAITVRKAFDTFVQEKHHELTLSAAMIMVDGKFPAVRFGELADEALKSAKKEAPKEKNRISVFGNVLTWGEFESAQSIAHELSNLYQEGKLKRRVIHRIQMSHIGYEKLQEKAIKDGVIHNPDVWKLFYFIRDSAAFDNLNRILKVYEKALLNAITLKKRMNAAAMTPVAARWAEFLTRKKLDKHER